jgi:hypothetical protein
LVFPRSNFGEAPRCSRSVLAPCPISLSSLPLAAARRRAKSGSRPCILREANLEGQIAEALAKIERPSGDSLASGIRRLFRLEPVKEWRAHIVEVVKKLARRGGTRCR